MEQASLDRWTEEGGKLMETEEISMAPTSNKERRAAPWLKDPHSPGQLRAGDGDMWTVVEREACLLRPCRAVANGATWISSPSGVRPRPQREGPLHHPSQGKAVPRLACGRGKPRMPTRGSAMRDPNARGELQPMRKRYETEAGTLPCWLKMQKGPSDSVDSVSCRRQSAPGLPANKSAGFRYPSGSRIALLILYARCGV